MQEHYILTEKEINDDLLSLCCADQIAHRAELRPGARIEHHQDLNVVKILDLHVFANHVDSLVGIDERQVRWRRHTVHDRYLLAQRFENACHPEFAAQCIAIRPDMACK